VRWSLLAPFEWLLEVGTRLVNEEPYPNVAAAAVPDATAWYSATLSPPPLDAEEERRWFLRRSDWRHHHALRRAAVDAALPNLSFRRLGDEVEVSWDNDEWSPPRRDLRFTEGRGRELVPSDTFATVLRGVLRDALAGLRAEHSALSRLTDLAERADALVAVKEDWRWLVHEATARVICEEMPVLRERLDAEAAAGIVGLHVPHARDTQLLRLVRLETREDVEATLAAASLIPATPVTRQLQALVRPSEPASRQPWIEGNDRAEEVREALGWGSDPLPDLGGWLRRCGCVVREDDLRLPPAVSLLVQRTEDSRVLAHVNPAGLSRMRRETGLATALGHVVMDRSPFAVDGDWEHWPTSARARAFGVALMLPEDGVRGMVDRAWIGPDELRAVMAKYRTSSLATTLRLRNMGLISSERQVELAGDVA
jgi:Zn-dependent peptidase ImmA (M78 family)